jgi:HlyD family secretion protein
MRKRTLIAIVVVLVLAVVLYEIILHTRSRDDVLVVSGRVEANETELSARTPGRLSKVLIDDGVRVRKGDAVALIEDDELRSKQREFTRKTEELTEGISAAEFNLTYTTKNVKHGIDEAGKTLSVAEARLRQAEAKRENAEKELTRYSRLRGKEAISEERLDNTRLAHKLTVEEVNTALEEVERAKVSLRRAEDSRELVKAKEKELLALRKTAGQLKEALTQVEINLGYTRITAPVDGVILRKVSEPGEVLSLGGVVAVMINPEDLHVKTYVPEKYIGRLRMNMQAGVVTDAYPGQPVTGHICYISDRAEFTPKEVQSYEERVKEVFAVKLCFSGKDGSAPGEKAYYDLLKKGMPVDVRFSFEGKK